MNKIRGNRGDRSNVSVCFVLFECVGFRDINLLCQGSQFIGMPGMFRSSSLEDLAFCDRAWSWNLIQG